MGEVRNEPSMEDILASIKRIIAEDGAAAPSAPRTRRAQPAASAPHPKSELTAAAPQTAEPEIGPEIDPEIDDEEVLELTDTIDAPEGAEPARPPLSQDAAPEKRQSAEAASPSARLVSESAINASRNALDALSAMIVKPETGADNTLDGLVREMLRPMLKEWLDARLPELVEKLVEKEIGRLTGRSF